MKTKQIIKFSVSLILVLTLLFSISLPAFAFSSPEKTGNTIEDFFNGLMFTLGFVIAVVVIAPLLTIPSLIQSLISEPDNFINIISDYIQDFLYMLGII
ncbi:MAG: hypothetical protein IJP20_02755 [Clostridia bacterium]|nr:hypothetical protein [Clostridia bacterium]